MRWLTLFALMATTSSHCLDINNPDQIITRLDNTESFSFFYVGHPYGAHKGREYWKKYNTAYPPAGLLKNIDKLKSHDFAVLGGDIVEVCKDPNIDTLNDLLLKPLELPVLNSTGNHDYCLVEKAGYNPLLVFTLGSNTFLVLSSKNRMLEEKHQDWLEQHLEGLITDPTNKRVFIFTHRPVFFLLDNNLSLAAQKSNFSVEQDAQFMQRFGPLLERISDQNKEIFWFAGDMGIHLPIAYSNRNPNIHFIASGLYERPVDHYISVQVNSSKVDMKVHGLVEEMNSEITDYSSVWVADFLSEDDSLDYDEASNLIDEYLKSTKLNNTVPIIPVKTDGDSGQAYNFFRLNKAGDLLLRRDNCGEESIRPFFVQFHPVRKKDRRHRNNPWNGYHFYARKIGNHEKSCFAVIPVPDYPIKYIQSGQLGKEKELIWQYRIVLK